MTSSPNFNFLTLMTVSLFLRSLLILFLILSTFKPGTLCVDTNSSIVTGAAKEINNVRSIKNRDRYNNNTIATKSILKEHKQKQMFSPSFQTLESWVILRMLRYSKLRTFHMTVIHSRFAIRLKNSLSKLYNINLRGNGFFELRDI